MLLKSSETKAGLWLPAILLLALLGALLARFVYLGTLYLTFFTDDFFYYLIVARNVVLHHASTFNGLQPTNGYHPLWLLTLVALYAITRGGLLFFVSLMLLIWLLIYGAFRCLNETERILSPGNITDKLTLPCALYSALFMAVVSRTGMEVSLALFFLILLWKRLAATPLEMQTLPNAALSGVLAACATLSRLDVAIVICVYLALALVSPRRAFGQIAAFCAGLLPVAIYVLTNILWFHTALPVSGMAKNLKPRTHLSTSTIHSLLHPDLIHLAFAWPSLLIAISFALLAVRNRRSPSRVQMCVLLHPVLFYTVLSLTSDWPLWTWYLYPLVPVAALLGPDVIAALQAATWVWPQRSLATGVMLLFLAVTLTFARINPDELLVYQHGLDLAKFAETHPGIYAMGDGAGTPAYLLGQPVLQLEGLMADEPFLDRIRHREPLIEALGALHVNYYVTNKFTQDDGCFSTREPSKAGPLSPAMKGRFCVPPLARLSRPGGDLLVFDLKSIPPR